jgi:hypothetical protein
LPKSTLSCEPIAITEPTNEPEVISAQAYPPRTSLAELGEQAVKAQLDQILEESSDFQPQVDPTDHSLVSSPAKLSHETGIDTAPLRQHSISSESTPTTGIWTPPSNDGTADTEPGGLVPSTRYASPSVYQAIPERILRSVTPSIEDQLELNESIRCSYCEFACGRICDLK